MTRDYASSDGLFNSTLLITLLSILGALINFVSGLVIAYFFGASQERDAYFSAIVIPAYISAWFAGSIGVIFVPVFIDHQTKNPDSAWQFASGFINLSILFLFLLSLLGAILSDKLTLVVAGGYAPAQLRLTTELLSILFPTILLGGLTAVLASLHYAEHSFVLPTLAPILATLATLTVMVGLSRFLGIHSLAYGTLVGAAAGCGVLMPRVLRPGRYRPYFNLQDVRIRSLIRASLPLLIAGLAFRLSPIVERSIASGLAIGSVSYLGYATQVMQILATVTSIGIATTVFPRMSGAWSANDLASVRRFFSIGVRSILFISVPVTALFIAAGETIINVVFERGAFDHQATLAVSQTLIFLLGAYVFNSLGSVVGKALYIAQRTGLAAFLSVVEMLIYVGLAILLSQTTSYLGLAMAMSVSTGFSVFAYSIAARRIYGGLGGKELVVDVMKIAGGGSVALGTMTLCRVLLITRISSVMLLVLICIAGGAAYAFFISYVLKLKDAAQFVEAAKEIVKGYWTPRPR